MPIDSEVSRPQPPAHSRDLGWPSGQVSQRASHTRLGHLPPRAPDLAGYITEGQIVLSAALPARGISPPVDALSSLSRLMRHGAGPGRTRDDHLDVAAQTLAALAAARRAR